MTNTNTEVSVKDLIMNNTVRFQCLRKNIAFYEIRHGNDMYSFPVPLEDIGEGTLTKEDKAIMFMRWIRKAKESGELVRSNTQSQVGVGSLVDNARVIDYIIENVTEDFMNAYGIEEVDHWTPIGTPIMPIKVTVTKSNGAIETHTGQTFMDTYPPLTAETMPPPMVEPLGKGDFELPGFNSETDAIIKDTLKSLPVSFASVPTVDYPPTTIEVTFANGDVTRMELHEYVDHITPKPDEYEELEKLLKANCSPEFLIDSGLLVFLAKHKSQR